MGRLRPPPYKRRACAPEAHSFTRNASGFRVCKWCNLSRQTLVDSVGQSREEFS